jgi:hypothetical protein
MHIGKQKDFLCASACARVLACPRYRKSSWQQQVTSQQLNSIYCEFLKIRLETPTFDILVQTLFSE